jgi:hypothetical protein
MVMATFNLDTDKIKATTKYVSNIPFGFTPSVGELNELQKLRDIINEYFEYLGMGKKK